MNIDDLLAGSGVDLGGLGSRLGLDADQTRAAMSSLLPAVVGGFQRQGNDDTIANVAQFAGEGAVDNPSIGNQILGQIFGSKDVSRQVAAHASGQSGVPDGLSKALLPIVAALVGAYLLRRGGRGVGATADGSGAPIDVPQQGGGGLGDLLGGLLGGRSSANPLESILGGLGGLLGGGRR